MTDDAAWLERQSAVTRAVFEAVARMTSAGETFVPFAPIERETKLTRGGVRRACRLLARRGLLAYSKGLWSDDGYPRGAGYGVTNAGQALLEMEEEE